ncbi:MAG TPA: hypothetical protein VF819_02715, partial [Nitrospira sp.]
MRSQKTFTLALLARTLILLLLSVIFLRPATGSSSPDGMALIPGGEFLMGSPAGADGLPDEQPQRKVYLGSFF